MSDKQKATSALFVAACIWGLNPFMSTLLLPYGTPITFISFRFFLSSTTILIYLLCTKRLTMPSPRMFTHLFLLGTLSVCCMNTTLLVGLKYSTITNAGVINALSPLIIAVFARIAFKEKLFRLQWLGVGIGLVGAICVITDGYFISIFSSSYNVGDILFLFAQICWALYTLISWGVGNKITLLELVMWSGYFGAFTNVIVGISMGELTMPVWNRTSIMSFAYSTWLSAMSCMILWNYGVKHRGPNVAAIYINLTTIVTIISGIIFLDEPFTLGKVVGTFGVLLGAILLTQYAYIHAYLKRYAWFK